MKKFLSLLPVLFLLLSSCGSRLVSADPTVPEVTASAKQAFVYDFSTDQLVLYSAEKSDGDDRVYPASITKLLTALYALEILPPDTLITPGEEVYLPPDGSSSAYIRPHHTLTLDMLIEGMMLPSGNDAAYAVAAACGRVLADDETLTPEEAVTVFTDGMNEYAVTLGCTGTHFTTPDGFAGEEHYSTAADMAKIAEAAAKNDLILTYAGRYTDHVIYASGHVNTWTNTNQFLNPSSPYYDERVIGLKTGSMAGSYSLVTLYDDGERRLLIGVFGCPTENARYRATRSLAEVFLN
ncbi:MAG: D-alanyl-D-alanine carboxypeptidase family protein [Eubacteriales bacterium]